MTKVIYLGKKNVKYLNEINKELSLFDKIVMLDHPRYIMQYKLKSINHYSSNYPKVLNSI